MTNAERLLRELRQAGRRGCTHRELEGAGVAYISVEVGRARVRGAVIREDRLRVSGQKRFTLIREPDVGRAGAAAALIRGRSEGGSPDAGASSPGAACLFDLPASDPRSPYDLEVEDAA